MNLTHALRLHLHLHLPLAPATPAVVAFVGAGGKSSALFRLAAEIVAMGLRVVTTTTTRIAEEQIALARSHLLVTGPQIDWGTLEQELDRHGHCLLLSDTRSPKATGIAPHLVDQLALRAPHLGLAAILVEADGSARRPVKAPATQEPVIPLATTLLVPVLGLDAIGLPLAEPYVHRPEILRELLHPKDPATLFTPQMAVRLLLHSQGGGKGRPDTARFSPLLNKADNPQRRVVGRMIAHLLAARGQSSLLATVGSTTDTPVRERWGPTSAVLLAAGSANRMGAPKQLLEIDGETLVVRAARRALESGAGEAVVVTGAYADRVEDALAELQIQAGNRLRVVHNPAWATGQASSIHTAVGALSTTCQAALFFPVDQPNVPVALLRRLWQPWHEGKDRVATLVDGEVRGAPALFDLRYFSELLALRGDQGARSLLKTDPAKIGTIPADAWALADVDTPEQWDRFLRSKVL